MLDQIVQGRPAPSYVSPAQCMPTTRDATLDNDRLPSPAIVSLTSYIYSLPEVTSGDLQPFQYMEHKQRLLSTDSGVECNHHSNTSNGDCPCKNFDPLTEAHNLHNSTYLAADDTSLSGNSKPKLVEEEAVDSDAFKSATEQNGNYITQETFNEMLTVSHTTQHIGSYVRPETLMIGWDNACAADSTYCQGTYNGSVSTDSGHVDEKHSDEVITGSHETAQDVQFNSDGYITSPID